MCLSVPGKVIKIEGEMATVSVGGTMYEASIQMLEDVEVGDYVLVHTGFAIQKIDEQEAHETLQLFNELEDFNRQFGPESDDDKPIAK